MKKFSAGFLTSRVKYHGRKSSDISSDFAFVGLGLMGNRVVDTIAQFKNSKDEPFYDTLVINSNLQDLNTIKNCNNKLPLVGYEGGAGRDPYIGTEAFEKNKQAIKERLDRLAKGKDMVFLVAGLGGGTGTGSIIPLIQMIIELDYNNFTLMLSLPRKTGGNQLENKNALQVLSKLKDFVNERSIGVVLIDNEILHNRYLQRTKDGKLTESLTWTEDSNLEIAGILHQLNLITSFDPFDERHFDSQEFLKVLRAGGCITFSRTQLDVKDFKDRQSMMNKIQNSIKEGILANGYDVNTATNAGFSVISPLKHSRAVFDIVATTTLEESIDSILPNAAILWGSYVDELDAKDKVEIFSIISGMGLPSRVLEIKKYVDQYQERKNATKPKDFDLSIDIEEDKPKKLDVNSIGGLFNRKSDIKSQDLFGERKSIDDDSRERLKKIKF